MAANPVDWQARTAAKSPEGKENRQEKKDAKAGYYRSNRLDLFPHARLGRDGIASADVLATIEALAGRRVGLFDDGDRRFQIAVRLPDKARVDAEALASVPVAGTNGARVPLSRVTRTETIEAAATVNRESGRRRVVVQANVRGRDVGGFVAEARAAIDRRVKLPDGVLVKFGGTSEHLERARARLLFIVPIALVLIFALLYMTYGRVLDALRIFLGVPFSAAGGVAALALRDMPFSIAAGVGFIALAGVSVLGDMILVSRFRANLSAGLAPKAAIEEAALTRLRPVLATALVASLGFLPMALSHGVGAEVQRPLATVVVGGVLSSVLLTLLVLPALRERAPQLCDRFVFFTGGVLTTRTRNFVAAVKRPIVE